MASGVYRISGSPNVHLYKQISGGVTSAFKAGDLVTVHATTGDLIIAAAGHVLGIALANAPGDATTDVPVDVITTDDSEFLMKYGTTTAATLAGKKASITFTTTAVTCVAGNGEVVVQGLDSRDAVGLSGGRVIVRFKAASLDGETGL